MISKIGSYTQLNSLFRRKSPALRPDGVSAADLRSCPIRKSDKGHRRLCLHEETPGMKHYIVNLDYQETSASVSGFFSGTRASIRAHVPAFCSSSHRSLLQPQEKMRHINNHNAPTHHHPCRLAAGDPPIPCKSERRTERVRGTATPKRSGSLFFSASVCDARRLM